MADFCRLTVVVGKADGFVCFALIFLLFKELIGLNTCSRVNFGVEKVIL